MPKLKVLTIWEDEGEMLRRPAKRVRTFDRRLHRLLENMVKTMREGKGVGLAAPQVGLDQRIFVIEYPEDEEEPEETMQRYEIINPEIVKARGSEIAHEACLSLPGLAAEVDRATYVLVKAQDRHGKPLRIKAYDWLARIFQHEIDHLSGVLMIDKAEQVYKVVEVEDGDPELVPVEELFHQDK
ncbi:MAG: peptide deformylase [Caldilineaceae bacterium]|nr:peptide deformylase [Caldilineaceae bacterium]